MDQTNYYIEKTRGCQTRNSITHISLVYLQYTAGGKRAIVLEHRHTPLTEQGHRLAKGAKMTSSLSRGWLAASQVLRVRFSNARTTCCLRAKPSTQSIANEALALALISCLPHTHTQPSCYRSPSAAPQRFRLSFRYKLPTSLWSLG